jgi:hypothetical protein
MGRVGVEGPPGYVQPAIALDMTRGKGVMIGGSNAPGTILIATWPRDGRAWACTLGAIDLPRGWKGPGM